MLFCDAPSICVGSPVICCGKERMVLQCCLYICGCQGLTGEHRLIAISQNWGKNIQPGLSSLLSFRCVLFK
uniref:Uncharacterized protein n=1 Tax=Anguilla anguilla TaxID=7936 RepID=A0A0E9WE30_ANGAN